MRRLTIEAMQAIAAACGGRCLSTQYLNNRTPLEWECAQGHRWWATPGNVKSNSSWCDVCAKKQPRRPRFTMDDLQALAASHGGECLSATYENQNQLLRWRCANGHEWMSPARVAKRHWCQRCHHERHRLGIEMMREIAASRGGRCLYDVYVSTRQPLQWECLLGHVWSTKPAVVVRGHWCPQCAYPRKSSAGR